MHLICRTCGWHGDAENAHVHGEISAPSTLVCPSCFNELDEMTEDDWEELETTDEQD